jgi:hypothetical protein
MYQPLLALNILAKGENVNTKDFSMRFLLFNQFFIFNN